MLQEVSSNKLKWVMVTSPSKKNLAYLWDNFPIKNEDLAATLPPLQRPRVVPYDDYVFTILQFPYYDKESGDIKASELDLFISKTFIITVTDGHLPPLIELFDRLYDHSELIHAEFHSDPGKLLYEILESLLQYQLPMLNHIAHDVDTIEEAILDELPASRKSPIQQILRVKRNVVNYRKVVQSHRELVRALLMDFTAFYHAKHTPTHLQILMSHTVEVWNALENYRDTINALHETHESLITFRTNQIMKTLTIFSVIVFPLTLFAAIFGMNTKFTPLVDDPNGFWEIIAYMSFGAIVLYGYFKHKKWI